MMKTELAAVSLILTLILTGCFSPDYGQRPFTCPQGACPSGYECRQGVCVTPGETTDAGVDQRAELHHPLAPLVVNIVTETTKAFAECPDGEFAIGGGVNCRTTVQTSSVTEAGDWSGRCVADEPPTKVSAYCLPALAFAAITWPRGTGTASAKSACSGETLLAGGSCRCIDSWIVGSYPEDLTWHCDCHSGQALVVAHCVPFNAAATHRLQLSHEGPIVDRSATAACPPMTTSIGGGCVGSSEGFRQVGNCGGYCYTCEMSEAATHPLPENAASVLCINDTSSQ